MEVCEFREPRLAMPCASRPEVARYTDLVPLPSYAVTHLGASVWASLQPWYDALSASSDLKLIQRNIDRECDRSDIAPRVWLDFLLDVAASHSGPDACQTIDTVLGRKRSYFSLSGLPLPMIDDSRKLYRFMRLDHFLKYMLAPLPIVPSSYPTLAHQINSGLITGANLDTKQFGRADYPIWCTLSWFAPWRATADRARDRFGLKHIDTGHLVEMEYPASLLKAKPVSLKPPTVLDSWATGATNWIFAKKRGMAGPDWGYTVDMDGGGACGKGSTEAVHGDFQVPSGQGWSINLSVHGPLGASAPAIDYGKLLINPAI
jgi:hypothetical protein